MDDFLLFLGMTQGNEGAFECFVRKYYVHILRYCRHHCLCRETAEDLTQETFLKFFAALPSYRHRGKAKNYLYTIAGNLCKNMAKKNAAELAEPEILERWPIVDETMDRVAVRIDVEQAINALTPEEREVLVLFYFQQCRIREIADILKIGIPLVKYRLKRAREKLKLLLGKEGVYGSGEKLESI